MHAAGFSLKGIAAFWGIHQTYVYGLCCIGLRDDQREGRRA